MVVRSQVEFDLSNTLDKLLADLDRSSAEVQKAVSIATQKHVQWVEREALKLLSDRSGISEQLLKTHKRISSKVYGDRALVWLGLNPFPVHRLGTPVKNEQGVEVAGETYKRAFVARDIVFKRKSKSRLPIEKVSKDMNLKSSQVKWKLQRASDKKYIELLTAELANFKRAA